MKKLCVNELQYVAGGTDGSTKPSESADDSWGKFSKFPEMLVSSFVFKPAEKEWGKFVSDCLNDTFEFDKKDPLVRGPLTALVLVASIAGVCALKG